ncbi:hypothetical protein MA16_Dca006552 [Dendrobium catenatum]|uniref:Uncharacterized protein n=1 Tax=Dendrobium catenatum TaxID=906689 RepID=A0A2I0XGV7_9ASPA|nr:hypothetical protein MA16_Dca006552 [Dendrobium catenatum]
MALWFPWMVPWFPWLDPLVPVDGCWFSRALPLVSCFEWGLLCWLFGPPAGFPVAVCLGFLGLFVHVFCTK